MLNELALVCYENGIYEFGALPVGDENFEDLSPKAKCAIIDMLATIRELQARVVASDERCSNYARDADRERHLARLRQIEHDQMQAQVTRMQERVARLEKAADPDDDCECVVRTELEARVAELEADATLGRLVREMPGGYKLIRMADYKQPWLCLAIGDDSSLYEPSEFHDTPAAALEAAQKEEP